MRYKSCRLALTLIVVTYVVITTLYLLLVQVENLISTGKLPNNCETLDKNEPKQEETIEKSTTVIIRDFEDFDNQISETVWKIEKVFPSIKVLIVADSIPYPPLNIFENKNVELMVPNPLKPVKQSYPSNYLQTRYVLILPDGAYSNSSNDLQGMKELLEEQISNQLVADGNIKAVAAPIGKMLLHEQSISVDIRRWTLAYGERIPANTGAYDAIIGPHALFLKSQDLLEMAEPFARPFLETFYIQASLRKWKIKVYSNGHYGQLRKRFTSEHNRWKHKEAEKQRRLLFYNQFGIKQVLQHNGSSELYGCSKQTSRCFGTVINDMPSYLYESKWTPPCCLEALRKTTKHVFNILDSCNVRYWLEGGSLLGAARSQDIISWDYDVDIGIYKEDVWLCEPLVACSQESFLDEDGYKWERASEGDFYRVQYSLTNHMHVDIFPFYPKDGIMTKDTWIKSHRQDMPFPEKYLKPRIHIMFAGTKAWAPNNVTEFLEMKFGSGVIENPRYPDANVAN